MKIDNHIYFKYRFRVSERGACKHFGVKRKSYAGTIVQRLHYYYCGGAVNLYWQYLRYYRCEFNGFVEFLEKKHNLFQSEVNSLNSILTKYKNLSLQPSGSITNLMDRGEESSIEEIFESFLEGE